MTADKGRECDFIIETQRTIIFIELKRKTLTTDSRSGNSLQSFVDLSQSLIHALVQSGCHEYCLRKMETLDFDNGAKLELKGRNIERVSLTLFDFFGLQDETYVNQFLISLLNAKLTSSDEDGIKKIEKYLVELQNQYTTDLFKETYMFQERYELSSFMNCRFFSIPQLLEILSNTASNEDFIHELNRTRNMTTGSKDWFFEYYYSRFLHEESQKK